MARDYRITSRNFAAEMIFIVRCKKGSEDMIGRVILKPSQAYGLTYNFIQCKRDFIVIELNENVVYSDFSTLRKNIVYVTMQKYSVC